LISAEKMTELLAGGPEFARLRYSVAEHLSCSKTHLKAAAEYKVHNEQQLRSSKVVRNLMRCAIADIEVAAGGYHFETLVCLLAASGADVGNICHSA
jgi:hypothetical protein